MELRFVVGTIIVMIGLALMLPEKNVVQDVVQDKKVYDSPLKNQRVPDTARGYARSMVSAEEYEALQELIMLESSWNPEAQNPKSTAYGLGQFLDKTWDLVGIEKSADYRIQLIASHNYVMGRYGSWVKALEHHKQYGWY